MSGHPTDAVVSPTGDTTAARHVPMRTCIGCRESAPRADLVRHVLVDGVVTRDERRALPGRGAWLHDAESCRALAEKRQAFRRAFRTRG